MRQIEGIDEVVRKLETHWDPIEDHFNEENRKFKELLARDPDPIGRVLKCHLIVEHYLDRFIESNYEIEDLDEARLSFYQKAKLLPNSSSAAAFVKPAIVRLNSIRNDFSHDLQADVNVEDLDAINEVVNVVRQEVEYNSAVERIEAFTTIACTFLIVPPPELQEVFMDVFSEIEVHAL